MRTKRRHLVNIFTLCFLVIVAGTSSPAADFYVDPVDGSDDNSGLSPEESLRTITRALEIVRADNATPATINLAAGTYSAETNGETFPINMTAATHLLGDGPETTIILCEETHTDGVLCDGIADVQIEALSIHGPPPDASGAGRGIWLRNCEGEIFIRECVVALGRGISSNVLDQTSPSASLYLEYCLVKDGLIARRLSMVVIRSSTFIGYGVGGTSRKIIEDCMFIECNTDLYSYGNEIRRCEFYDSGISFGSGYNPVSYTHLRAHET